MVKTQVGDDAVHPGIEGALEAEIPQMAIGLEKGLLVNILRLGFRAGEMERQTKHRLVVLADEFLKRSARSALRFAYQIAIIDAVECVAHHRTPSRTPRLDSIVLPSLHSPRLPGAWHRCTQTRAEGDLSARHCGQIWHFPLLIFRPARFG